MPVLGQHHMIEAFSETIDDRHHCIAAGHCERAAGTEIVLHVDDDKHIILAWSHLHCGPWFVCRLTLAHGKFKMKQPTPIYHVILRCEPLRRASKDDSHGACGHP